MIGYYPINPYKLWTALSTDTKPTPNTDVRAQWGDRCIETDTQKTWYLDQTGNWNVIQQLDEDVLALTLSAQGAGTVNGNNIPNFQGRTLNVGVNITALGAGSLTVTVQGMDVSGTYYNILTSAALAATGFTLLSVGQGIPVTANVSANANVPRVLRVSATVATGPCTATIGLSLV